MPVIVKSKKFFYCVKKISFVKIIQYDIIQYSIMTMILHQPVDCSWDEHISSIHIPSVVG